MTNYQKGYRFEKEIQKAYEKKGYYVMRSSGSHGAIDLIATNKEEIRLIQAKAYSYEPTSKEIGQLRFIALNKFPRIDGKLMVAFAVKPKRGIMVEKAYEA